MCYCCPMEKYYALREYLASFPGLELEMSFADVERILRAPLPPSARQRPSWWSNNADRHAQAQAWLKAGWVTRGVDVKGERLRFERKPAVSLERKLRWEDVYGALKGMVKVAPGWDLTWPAWEGDADYLDKKYGRLPPGRKQRR